MNKGVILMMIMLHISVGNSVKKPLAPALYVFGDSLFDSGNNNLLPTVAKADFSPYGMSFKGGHTGRFTNGRTLVDFIAEFLGLPYAPPYLRLLRPPVRSEPLTGLNFASSSCGILPQTGSNLGKCLHFGEQVDLFQKAVEEEFQQHYHLDSAKLSSYMSRSIFAISIGNNDYLNNYLDSCRYDSRKRFSPQSFAKLLVDQLSVQFQRLYKLGARKVVMFEIGPIGCIPSIVKTTNHAGKCVEEVNELAVMFNDELASMLKNLTHTLKGSAFVLGRAHELAYDAVINPSKYGLSDSSNACCVAWLNGTSACIPELKVLACRHPNKHYFFDGYHLTETVYRTLATHCINDSSVCTPNLKELVLHRA